MIVVESAHISFDSSCLRVHTHKSGSKKRLNISYAVHGRHGSVHITMIGEHSHFGRCMESTAYLLIGGSGSLHVTIALTLKHRPIENLPNLCLRKCCCVRRIRFATVLLIESRLQILGHMLIDSLLGILLHTRVDCRIDFQAIGVDIVRRTILFKVLVAPPIERIRYPSNGVEDKLILIPRRIISPFRLFGHHVLTQILTKIDSHTILMVSTMEIEHQRLIFKFVILRF